MKVLCIKEGVWYDNIACSYTDGPKYGDICTVTKATEIAYFLLEWPNIQGWHQCGFIPISNIDERELVNELNEETA